MNVRVYVFAYIDVSYFHLFHSYVMFCLFVILLVFSLINTKYTFDAKLFSTRNVTRLRPIKPVPETKRKH